MIYKTEDELEEAPAFGKIKLKLLNNFVYNVLRVENKIMFHGTISIANNTATSNGGGRISNKVILKSIPQDRVQVLYLAEQHTSGHIMQSVAGVSRNPTLPTCMIKDECFGLRDVCDIL